MTMLKERREEIKRGLADAEKANQLLEEATEKEKSILRNAQAETKKMLDEAKHQAESLLADAKDASRKETEKMIKDAKEQIAFESREAEKRLASHISQLAIGMLSKSLPGIVTEDEQTAIVKDATRKLKGKIN
jgi:ATP synthase F0 subunit b